MGRTSQKLTEENVVIVGGRKGCSPAMVFSPLQQLAQKAAEWSHQEHIYVFDGDILKAFDNLRPSKAAKAMLMHGIHP